ncbi:MAG: NAD(P)H-hydrate dehydratase [Candidatus Heimdallarchaeota archaeon]|nr:NAD(P)H-hydrate dehydratase [Candidatus Heimdallarchaeota archaeon]MCK4955003.1 NAD(P)H-hydrate dehydratase [Candidatus Heimdallarchaeota archaeon]
MNKDLGDRFTIKMTRALEDNAFATGISIFEMMEIAGKVIAEEILKYAKKVAKTKIAILAGFGNNGGDGLVATKYLIDEGYECYVVLVGNKDKFDSKASQKNYEKLRKILPKNNWFKIQSPEEISKIFSVLDENTIVIDSLLGIGISGVPREPYKSVIEILNNDFKEDIIAVDIPSGYNPESGNTLFTKNPKKIVCLGRNKIEIGDFPNSDIVVRKIGIPEESEKYVGIGDLKWYYPQRKKNSHKRQNGVVTVIAGSIDYIGAPVLSAIGAFRTGADLLFILVPSNIRNTVASFVPDFITIPAHPDEVEPIDILDMFNHPRLEGSSFVIGPGMRDSEKTKESLLELLRNKEEREIVIDASALSIMEEDHLFLLKYHKTILTPHSSEFYRIFKIKLTGETEKDAKIIEELAAKWKTTILLKGQYDIISNGTVTKTNRTGHPGMTAAGTGDVLAGIVAALLSVIKDTFISACLGAYISGAAGELAAERYGDGLMASDIPNYIYAVIKKALEFKAKEI